MLKNTESSVVFLSIFLLVLVAALLGLPNLAVRKLVLREVLTHFVESVDCPECQFGHLHPPVVHRLGIHHDHHQVQRVLLKRGREARTSRWCDTSLAPVKALAQQLVRIGPVEVANFVLNVLALALVVSSAHNLAEDRILHHDARETTHVGRRRLVVLVREPVGIRVICRFQAQGSCVPIHLL